MSYYNSAALLGGGVFRGGWDITDELIPEGPELTAAAALVKKGRPEMPDTLANLIAKCVRRYDVHRMQGDNNAARAVKNVAISRIVAYGHGATPQYAARLFDTVKRQIHNRGQSNSHAAKLARRQAAQQYLSNPDLPWIGSSIGNRSIYPAAYVPFGMSEDRKKRSKAILAAARAQAKREGRNLFPFRRPPGTGPSRMSAKAAIRAMLNAMAANRGPSAEEAAVAANAARAYQAQANAADPFLRPPIKEEPDDLEDLL